MHPVATAAGLTPGDRCPDFVRPDQHGEPRAFYEIPGGRPVVLAVARAGTRLDDVLATLGALGSEACPVLLVEGDPTLAADVARASGADHPVLADDGAVTSRLVGRARAPVVLVLDPNLRLLGTGDPAPLLAALADDDPPRVVRRSAPVLLVPRVLSDDLVGRLVARAEADRGRASVMPDPGLGERVDRSLKRRRDHNLSPGLAKRVVAEMARLGPEVTRAGLGRPGRIEEPKLVSYLADEAGTFRPHRDNSSASVAHRRLAVTVNLNPGSYEGGALRFPEFGPDLYEPSAGGAVVFGCSLLHEVVPVTEGVRHAVITFLS